jgi:hypothetical protein
LPRSQHPRVRGLQRDIEDWKANRLRAPTVVQVCSLRFRASCLKNGSRAKSVGIEDVNRERPELEAAFPQFVIVP